VTDLQRRGKISPILAIPCLKEFMFTLRIRKDGEIYTFLATKGHKQQYC